jgi:prophage regulatory protein
MSISKARLGSGIPRCVELSPLRDRSRGVDRKDVPPVALCPDASGSNESLTGRRLRVLRLPQVQDCTGLRRSQIYALERAGKFPQRVSISERASGWLEHEVHEYIARRAALRIPRREPSLIEPIDLSTGDRVSRG